MVKIVIYIIKRGEFCLSVEVWKPIYAYMANNDEIATINHQVNQNNKSTGPKFTEVISYNMQMVLLKGFFLKISLLLLTLEIFHLKVLMCWNYLCYWPSPRSGFLRPVLCTAKSVWSSLTGCFIHVFWNAQVFHSHVYCRLFHVPAFFFFHLLYFSSQYSQLHFSYPDSITY